MFQVAFSIFGFHPAVKRLDSAITDYAFAVLYKAVPVPPAVVRRLANTVDFLQFFASLPFLLSHMQNMPTLIDYYHNETWLTSFLPVTYS